jgi:plastocyanin
MRHRTLLTATSALLGAAALVGATSFAMRAGEPPHQVRLVARGMAFHLEGDATPNPTIRVRAGERVEVTVRNDTPGIVHDFAVVGLGVSIAPIEPGAVGSTVLAVPTAAGSHEYVCRPHAQMMRGVLEVRE